MVCFVCSICLSHFWGLFCLGSILCHAFIKFKPCVCKKIKKLKIEMLPIVNQWTKLCFFWSFDWDFGMCLVFQCVVSLSILLFSLKLVFLRKLLGRAQTLLFLGEIDCPEKTLSRAGGVDVLHEKRTLSHFSPRQRRNPGGKLTVIMSVITPVGGRDRLKQSEHSSYRNHP